MGVIMRRAVLCFVIASACAFQGGVEIKKKEKYVKHERDPNHGKGEIYTSMKDLENFFKEELEFVDDLRSLYDKKLISMEAKGNVGAYIQSFEDVVGDQEEEPSIMHHPINAYNLLRHVAVGWSVVEDTLEQEVTRKRENVGKRVMKVINRRDTHHIPDQPDVDGVAKGIVRLHDYYKFNTTTFVNEGVIENGDGFHETTGDLSVWDAFKIGVKGTNAMILGSGIQILDEALAKAQLEGVTTPAFIEELDMKVLRNLVKTAKTVHDQKLDRWGDRTDGHSTNPLPYSKNLAKKKKFMKNKDKMENNIKLEKIDLKPGQEKYQYMELCKGRDLRPVSVTSQLYCKYSKGAHATFTIGPLKVEIVSLRPYITIIHNFILDSEADEIVTRSTPDLRRSEMVGKKGNGTMDDRRVSEQAWLNETDTAALGRITNRIDHFLNLNATSTQDAELYQVANYGLAGQYISHYDQVLMEAGKFDLQARDMFNIYAGDRLATFMGYLSDVPAGGYTVFPFVGAYVRPKKGSVVFWWNMDKNGGYDNLVKHGGCPVMIGSKWITNKWVRSNSQMFRRPCPRYSNREIRGFRENSKHQRGGFFTEP